MGLLRFMLGLMGLATSPEQDKDMRRISDNDNEDLVFEQREKEWDEPMKKDDVD